MTNHKDDWITLFSDGHAWQARFTGPHAREIRSLFGSDTLPTGFLARAPWHRVQAEIQRLNPGVFVTVKLPLGL